MSKRCRSCEISGAIFYLVQLKSFCLLCGKPISPPHPPPVVECKRQWSFSFLSSLREWVNCRQISTGTRLFPGCRRSLMEAETCPFSVSDYSDCELQEKIERIIKFIASGIICKLHDKGQKIRSTLLQCRNELDQRNLARIQKVTRSFSLIFVLPLQKLELDFIIFGNSRVQVRKTNQKSLII